MSISLGLSTDSAPTLREGAGFWVRALARGIDTTVHLGVGAAAGVSAGILIAIGSLIQGTSPDPALQRLSVNTPLGYVAAVIGMIAMHTLSEGLHGSTLGKRLCGLTVISEGGGPVSLLPALKRNVAYLWDSLFFGIIAAGKMSESALRQRHGDVWARTQVVRLSSLEPGARRSWLRFLAASMLGLLADAVVIFLELASKLL